MDGLFDEDTQQVLKHVNSVRAPKEKEGMRGFLLASNCHAVALGRAGGVLVDGREADELRLPTTLRVSGGVTRALEPLRIASASTRTLGLQWCLSDNFFPFLAFCHFPWSSTPPSVDCNHTPLHYGKPHNEMQPMRSTPLLPPFFLLPSRPVPTISRSNNPVTVTKSHTFALGTLSKGSGSAKSFLNRKASVSVSKVWCDPVFAFSVFEHASSSASGVPLECTSIGKTYSLSAHDAT